MRSGNLIWAVLMICFLATPVMAQPGKGPVEAPEKKTECAPLPGETSPDEVVIGGNLSTSHSVKDAMLLMGIPEFIKINRGTDPGLDNIELAYSDYGLVIRALTDRKKIEMIEMRPDYSGKLSEGDLKIKANFDDVVANYGVPNSLEAQVGRYPEQGVYFLFNEKGLLAGKICKLESRLQMCEENRQVSAVKLSNKTSKSRKKKKRSKKGQCDPAPGSLGPGDVVIGANLSVDMPLKDAINLLGVPEFIKLNRGTDPGLDNIEITYTKYDLVLRTLTEGKVVEGIEIGPNYKGSFGQGDIRLGANFDDVVQSFGIPASLTAQVARYPDQGIYFLFSDANLLSVKTYSKNTRLLDARLMNP